MEEQSPTARSLSLSRAPIEPEVITEPEVIIVQETYVEEKKSPSVLSYQSLKSPPSSVKSPKVSNNGRSPRTSFKSGSQKSHSSTRSPKMEIGIAIMDTDITTPVDDITKGQVPGSNIDKIAAMSKILTKEANALRDSIRTLSLDIARTKQDLNDKTDDYGDFPHHLFLVELVVNKIQMKCQCFETDFSNLMITAAFLGRHVTLYDSSYGNIENISKLNVGKSTLFAMTYDRICSIQEFIVQMLLSKHPPCSHCVTKIGETQMDYSKEYLKLREELCQKWCKDQPEDNINCTTSTPLMKNKYYISCSDSNNPDPIGIVEVSTRLSFMGKEVTTVFNEREQHCASIMLKENDGIKMYSCQKVEMDDAGKVMLDENVMGGKYAQQPFPCDREDSPMMSLTNLSKKLETKRYSDPVSHRQPVSDGMSKYDEIYTKMNDNELKIRVPKTTKVERTGKYDKINELCECDSNPYNGGEQIQFEMPKDLCHKDQTHNTYTSNLKYTYKGCDRACEPKPRDRKVINVTPTNCPAPVNLEKVLDPHKDVFILKIGKKLETKDKKTDLEIELVTPKAPDSSQVHMSQQYSDVKLKGKKKKKGKAGKSKSKTSVKSKGKPKGKKKGKK